MNAILITGPTASGKSALALDLARRHEGVVINADSMQVYDTLRILTARPSRADMDGVAHFLYGHVPASAPYSTGSWLRDVADLLATLKAEARLPIFVGGTGLYFKALLGGLSEMPQIPTELREEIRERLRQEGPVALHRELLDLDPQSATELDAQDGQRIARALEVLKATGLSIRMLQSRKGTPLVDPDGSRKIIVLPDRDALKRRINNRFAEMMAIGAIEEVQQLLALNLTSDMPVMKAIGVSEITALLDGSLTEREVIEKASAATRQYAKRQMTWFRNQMDERWERLDPSSGT